MQHGKTLLAAALISFNTLNVQAALSTTVNGLGVYDSGLNATWTQDGNLLGTLEANAIAKYGNDSSLITDIINASGGVIHDTPNYYDGSFHNYDGDNNRPLSGAYALSINDFGSDGTVNWFAGQAFVHYLNTQNYAGSNQWALPSAGADPQYGYNQTSSQLGQLYYKELDALAYPGTNGSDFGILHDGTSYTSGSVGPFASVQNYAYWYGTEYVSNPGFAWSFGTYSGYQDYNLKGSQFYVWVVSHGQLSAVPIPSTVWFFGSGLLGLLGLKRCGHTG